MTTRLITRLHLRPSWVIAIAILIQFAAFNGTVLGQDSKRLRILSSPIQTSGPPEATGEQQLEGPLHEALREATPKEGQALEGAIDPQTYRLGPGDLLSVSFMGEVDQEFLARVSADGTLRIPTLGIFEARDQTFGQMRETILTKARSSYKINDIAVYLVELRNFKASVGGMVWTPGTYVLTATDRVTELIIQAGGFYNPTHRDTVGQVVTPRRTLAEPEQWIETLPDLPRYSARRAQLIHRDRRTEGVDLLLFLRSGRPEGNPYVQDGDFLLIPPLNSKSGVLGTFGSLNYPGWMEYVEGDNVEKALLLAGGITLNARRDSVEITRFLDSAGAFQTFYVNLDDPGALATALQPDDRVFVRPRSQHHPRCQVELRGEIVKPGFYPVAPDGTPLTQIVQQAGGFTPLAGLREATLTRRLNQPTVDPEFLRLSSLNAADLSPLEVQYLKTRTQELKGMVAVNLQKLFAEGDASQNILLRDQDLLEIPAATHTVKVTGQVKQPGYVQYQSGESYSYYIKEAGGYSGGARSAKTRIIKANSGQWIKPQHTPIEEGDVVFVPGKPYVDYWRYTREIITILTQFATIYLVIYNTTK